MAFPPRLALEHLLRFVVGVVVVGGGGDVVVGASYRDDDICDVSRAMMRHNSARVFFFFENVCFVMGNPQTEKCSQNGDYISSLPILYKIQRRRNEHTHARAHAQRKKQRNKERERLFALFLYSPSRKNEIYVGYKKKPACSCKFRVVF